MGCLSSVRWDFSTRPKFQMGCSKRTAILRGILKNIAQTLNIRIYKDEMIFEKDISFLVSKTHITFAKHMKNSYRIKKSFVQEEKKN